MQLEIKRIAGICVFLAAAISVNAQQKHPPNTSKTVTVKKTVVPAKTAPPKGVVVIKKTVTTKTTTTRTVSASNAQMKAAPSKHKVAKRRVRKHVRYARRRSHHYRRIVHRTTITHTVVASTVETGLVGVHLFDSGIKVLGMYGNPNFILNLGENPSTAAPGPAAGGGGAGFGGPGFGGGSGGAPGFRGGFGGGPAMGRGGANRPTGRPNLGDNPPDGGLSDPNSDLQGPAFAGKFGGRFGGGGQGPGGQFGQGPNVGGGQGAGATPAPTYIQWIYKEGAAQYKFIIDQHDRVVQIEAIGMDDPKVRTSHGITFGATFKTLVDRYGIPDAYEITGDNLVLRYLNKYHVAFRLNRLETNQPHEVTAIVVSGGKG